MTTLFPSQGLRICYRFQPEFVNLFRSQEIESQPLRPTTLFDVPARPGYKGWRNRFLGFLPIRALGCMVSINSRQIWRLQRWLGSFIYVKEKCWDQSVINVSFSSVRVKSLLSESAGFLERTTFSLVCKWQFIVTWLFAWECKGVFQNKGKRFEFLLLFALQLNLRCLG